MFAIPPGSPETWTGFGCGFRSVLPPPGPNCPLELLPHAQIVPSSLRATLNSSPAAMRATFERPVTCNGVVLLVVPFPSWPIELKPMAQTVLSVLSINRWRFPPAIAVTLVIPFNWTGLVIRSKPPVRTGAPHIQTVPSVLTAAP